MPVKRCSECKLKSWQKSKGSWQVETLTPKMGKNPKTEEHYVTELRHLARLGNCYNRYEYTTACGVIFTADVDSSD